MTLRAGDKCIGSLGGIIVSSVPLVLQTCHGGKGQRFALDGDSIIFTHDRNYIVKVTNANPRNHTILSVGERRLAEEELWDFEAVDGSASFPTKGFVRVQYSAQLIAAINNASWGTVIEVDSPTPLYVFDPLTIKAGVTLRGNRQKLQPGAEIYWPQAWEETDQKENLLFHVQGAHARISGLKLHGPSASTIREQPSAKGILAYQQNPTLIDHNELYNWPGAAVIVFGSLTDQNNAACNPNYPHSERNVKVIRNYIHHNQREGTGYGVSSNNGANPLILGNTFLLNRHAIHCDGDAVSGYLATGNIVLSAASTYGWGPFVHYEQDFDVHGTNYDDGHYMGGIGGAYTEISYNTFLGNNSNETGIGGIGSHRINFFLRGEPCNQANFHHNVARHSQGNAIKSHYDTSKLVIRNNQFQIADPTDRLGVGDFDGDGRDDLFLATGAAFYYSSAGTTEWRFLRSAAEKLDELLLGDFNGDKRTDIVKKSGTSNVLVISWGGLSSFVDRLNEYPGAIDSLVVGDFTGDERADLFYTDRTRWYVADGGNGEFTWFNSSNYALNSLRFGDFNGDGKTDVFGIVSGDWRVKYYAHSDWARLRSALETSISKIVIADFDGDGYADVATSVINSYRLDYRWRVSHSGTGDFGNMGTLFTSISAVPALGRFDQQPGIDAAFWHEKPFTPLAPLPSTRQGQENYLDFYSSGAGDVSRLSVTDLR